MPPPPSQKKPDDQGEGGSVGPGDKDKDEDEGPKKPREPKRSPYLALKGIPILKSRVTPYLYDKVRKIQNKFVSAEEEKEEIATLAFEEKEEDKADETAMNVEDDLGSKTQSSNLTDTEKLFLESKANELKIIAEKTFEQLKTLDQQPISVPCPRSPWDPTWYQVHKVAGDILGSLHAKEE